MLRDIHTHLSPALSLVPAVRTADANGTSVDLALYSAADVVFYFGASGDTLSGSVYVAGVVQESDDDVTFTDVADADLVGTEPLVDAPGEASAVHSVGYIGNKRYIRAKLDFTGTHTNGIGCATLIVRGARRYGSGTIV